MLLFCYSALFSSGRPIAAEGLVSPGSLLTRFLNINVSFWLRRLIEPSLWILILCVIVSAATTKTRKVAIYYGLAAILLCAIVFFESFLLHPLVQDSIDLSESFYYWSHFFLTASAIILLALAPSVELMSIYRSKSIATSVLSFRGIVIFVFFITSLLGVTGVVAQEFFVKARNPLVGAHYYLWFPENWAGGYVGKELRPQIAPLLGEYSSNDVNTFAQHVSWAKEAGINFFIFDWWPERPSFRKRILTYLRDRSLWDGFKFAIHYETLDLKTAEKSSGTEEDANVLVANDDRGNRMKRHWEHIAINFMTDNSYLRIDNRPVLFLYATRHVVGDVAKMINDARDHVRRKTGTELFLVGDEVFPNVLTMDKDGKVLLKKSFAPDWDRLLAFDAITAYNPYDSTRVHHAGELGAENFLNDVAKLYLNYKAICETAGILFIPSVLPAYNDRGVRASENHFVIPREFYGNKKKSFFKEGLNRLIKPFLDIRNPIFSITSWNEWNEFTQIEPSNLSISTIEDSSHEEHLYSNFSYHGGYGCEHLDELQDFLSKLPK